MSTIKHKQTKALFSLALLLTGSFAHATPATAPTASVVEIILQWLSPTQQSQPGECNNFPECESDLAPAPQPIDEAQ